eukprot:NODE_130_length_18488_cov_0.389961.p2 type:complete len:412 gc:universal NODE_130_length_18488_cov_0.389961:9609-10844(+)
MLLDRKSVLSKYPSFTFESPCKINSDYITPLTTEYCLIRQRENINSLEDVRVAVIGNVDAGKSSILGVLTKGKLDDGRGKAREVLFKHKHELLTGRTSSVGMEIMGFDEYGAQILKNKMTWDEVACSSSKMITFLDLAGHEKYLKTTVYGLSSSQPDYAMLMVGANAGMIGMTKEHLGLTLLLNIPSIIVITKIDMAPPDILKQTINQLQKILKSSGCRKLPMFIRTNNDVIKVALNFTGSERICPVFMVSNVTGEGIDLLKLFLNILPSTQILHTPSQSFENTSSVSYEITESFSVPGVGCVVSGHLLTGTVSVGDMLLIGPDKNGVFINTQIKGIHRKRVSIHTAMPGQGVSFALKKVKRNQIRKGMVIVSKDVDTNKHVTREFEAEILVLHHSTTIAVNYQTMLHSRK